jgi:hypothetical protein
MSLRFSAVCMLAITATTLVGCSSQSPSSIRNGSINAGAVLSDKSLTPEQKAQKLADTSEQLLSAQGFDYANDVAGLALEQDANNVKAQFIQAVLAPIMVQRGLIARVAPLAQLDPKANEQYTEMLGKIDEQPDSTLKTFALDGKADIATESDSQAQLDAQAEAWGKIREFAKSHKASEIVMLGTDLEVPALVARHEKLCTVTSQGSYRYDMNCPSQVKMLQTTLDRGDLEVVQQYAAGVQLYLSLYNSYDLTGAIKVAQDNAAKQGQPEPTPKEIIDQLLANPKFATLRAGNAFAKVKSLGADAITGLRWVMSNQSKLCPMGSENPHNRIGALVNNGICVPSSQQAGINTTVRKVEAALAGGLVPTQIGTSYGPIPTVLKPAALLDQPIADIRSIGPVTFTHCGTLASIGDATVGGLFVKGDANNFLQLDAQKCH